MLLRLVEGLPDESVLLAQRDSAKYDEPWFEGSQSFGLIVPADIERYESGEHLRGGRQIVADVNVYRDGVRADDHYIGGIILWAMNGLMSSLEYYWVTDDMPTSLPRLEEVLP